jgi:hypothetical protein
MVEVPAGSVNRHGDLDCQWRCLARLLRPDGLYPEAPEVPPTHPREAILTFNPLLLP